MCYTGCTMKTQNAMRRGHLMMRTAIGCLLIGALLAACSAPPEPDRNEPMPTPRALDTPLPTLPPPPFQVADTRITAQNADELRYLGRLSTDAARPSSIFAHTISLDGTRLAALNNDLLVVWNLTTGASVFTEGRLGATRVYYSPDKTELYTLGSEGLVFVHDANTGADLNRFQVGVAYSGASAFYAEDGWLAVGGNDGRLQVWDAQKRLSLSRWDAVRARITALAFDDAGERLLSATDDGTVQVWDWRERRLLASHRTQYPAVMEVAFSPDGTQFSLATPFYVETYSLTENRFLWTIEIGVSDTSDVFGYSPDGRYLLSGGSADTPITVLNAADGAVVAQLPQTNGTRTAARFGANGALLATTVLDGPVNLWNLAEATTETIPSARLLVGSTRITGVEWSDDGFTLAFFDASGYVYLWGIRRGS
jgi:WD40 repeat protein